jgi:hypothetical protein
MGESKRRKAQTNDEPYRYRVNKESFKYLDKFQITLISPNIENHRVLLDAAETYGKIPSSEKLLIQRVRDKVDSQEPQPQQDMKESAVLLQFIKDRFKRTKETSLLCINCDVGFYKESFHIGPEWIILIEATRNDKSSMSWHTRICHKCYRNNSMNDILEKRLKEVTGGQMHMPDIIIEPIN